MSNRKTKPALMVITGGNGLIGTRLQHDFVRDFRVVCLDIQPSPDPAPGVSQVYEANGLEWSGV